VACVPVSAPQPHSLPLCSSYSVIVLIAIARTTPAKLTRFEAVVPAAELPFGPCVPLDENTGDTVVVLNPPPLTDVAADTDDDHVAPTAGTDEADAMADEAGDVEDTPKAWDEVAEEDAAPTAGAAELSAAWGARAHPSSPRDRSAAALRRSR
jgi:hypothetical protein